MHLRFASRHVSEIKNSKVSKSHLLTTLPRPLSHSKSSCYLTQRTPFSLEHFRSREYSPVSISPNIRSMGLTLTLLQHSDKIEKIVSQTIFAHAAEAFNNATFKKPLETLQKTFGSVSDKLLRAKSAADKNANCRKLKLNKRDFQVRDWNSLALNQDNWDSSWPSVG